MLALVAAACGGESDTAADAGGGDDATTGSTAPEQIEGEAPEVATTDTIVIGVPTLQEQYVDPHFAVGGLLFPMRWAISETLYRQNEQLAWEPNMATGYEISDDNLTWTFTLRDDILMQDGSNFTANDVKTAIDRILGSEDFAHLATFRANVSGAEVIDDYTVAITTNGPYATLLSDMPPPIPTDYYNEVGEEGFRAKPIAAGAWKFESQELNASITYSRFDDFFDESRKPNFEHLVYKIIPDESARVAGLQTGDLDMAFGLTALSASQLEQGGDTRVIESPDTGMAYLFPLDLVAPDEASPLQDVRVRKALLMAIDRDAIATSLYQGYARVPAGALPPTTLGYDPDLAPYPFDPDAAKALLEEAGASDLTITLNSYNSTPTVPDVVKLGETVAAYWEQIGVTVNMNVVDTATILPAWRGRQLRGMGLLAGPSQYYDEPSRLMSSFFTTEASYSTVSDPELDALAEQLDVTVDMDEREKLGVELDTLLYDQLYGLPLILVSSLIGVGPDVATFEPMLGSPYAGPLWSLQAN
ncbi:MAG: ABC transporter substrate-binding protein [Acidimicrobiales bacterium]